MTSFFFLFCVPSAFFCWFFFSVRPTVYIEVAPPLVNNNATRLHTPQPIVLSFFPLSYRSSSRKKNRSQTPPRDGGDPRLTSLFYTEIERPLKMVKICFTAISLSRWYSIFCWCFCFVFWVSYIKSVANEWKENLKMFFFILFHAGKKKRLHGELRREKSSSYWRKTSSTKANPSLHVTRSWPGS